MGRTWRLGTRGSLLARTQSGHVAAALRAATGDEVELVLITTRGDRVVDRPLPEVGGKGLFTQELEDGLLAGELDLAVHSLKDLPSEMPPGLCLAAVPPRADARDALCGHTLAALPHGARVGTGSARRRLQLLAVRPDLDVVGLRGNVPTRLAKVPEGAMDAVVLAAAGLDRIDLGHEATERLDPDVVVPAAGQGALAVQARADRADVLAALATVHDAATAYAVQAERAFLAALHGGCSVPAACHVTVAGDLALIRAFYADDAGQVWRAREEVPAAAVVGRAAAIGAGWASRG